MCCCMVAGVPRMCIKMYGTRSRATVGNISESICPIEMSLIMSASHFSMASEAMSARKVSTETGMSGEILRIICIPMRMRRISSSTDTSSAPGREEYPPRSIMSAPSEIICFALSSIAAALNVWEPA